MSDFVIGDGETASSLGIDMSGFDEDGYMIRRADGDEKTLILGKTDSGDDRSVRYYAENLAAAGGRINITEGEDFRINKLLLSGRDIGEFVIILPDSYPDGAFSECVEFAAESLRDGIFGACGVSMNIMSRPYYGALGLDMGVISLELYDEEDSALGEDGFRITLEKNRLTVMGGIPRGCMYGVFDFLENKVGYRYISRDITYIYPSECLDREDFSYADVPSFSFRRPHTGVTFS